jgi:hypothetical protein
VYTVAPQGEGSGVRVSRSSAQGEILTLPDAVSQLDALLAAVRGSYELLPIHPELHRAFNIFGETTEREIEANHIESSLEILKAQCIHYHRHLYSKF